jgi:hypothetical protein
MNIVVKPYGSDMCCCRPDTTWERENRDLYSPECVNAWEWTPVLFARISKAGKCISPKFASRYYDSLNFGALLYIGGVDKACGSCADHTSILPLPLFNPVVMESEGNKFEVLRNDEIIFSLETPGYGPVSMQAGCEAKSLIQAAEEAICNASQLTSLRIGDYVAVELAPASVLAKKSEGSISFKATFCENEIFNFKVIF